MKKILWIFLILTLFLINTNVMAKEVYYQNGNGVAFSKEEYEFLSNFYFEGYQDYMTLDDYLEFIDSDIMSGKIQTIQSEEPKDYIMPLLDAIYNGNKKSIKLSSSCSGNTCNMAITLNWAYDPICRSYDLIGSLVQNTTILGRKKSTLMYNGNQKSVPVNNRLQSNAFSSTYMLPASGSNINIVEQFTVQNTGKVIASYQHAIQNIGFQASGNYNFSINGYGAVFGFYNGVGAYYDNMPGVYLILG